MSAAQQKMLFYLTPPDLSQLCCVTATLPDDQEPRSRQLMTCREMVLRFSEILVSPGLDSFTEITTVMTIHFFQDGILHLFGQRRGLQLGSPHCVSPGLLQSCVSFTLITRLSPSWNKVCRHLVHAEHFLTECGPLEVVSMELTTRAGQLCFSVEANTVRLQPTTLEELVLSLQVLREFWKDPDSVLHPVATGGALWCHLLPSMKKGQIVSISRRLPRDGPFQSYRELQHYWTRLYGYQLPELSDSELVYCSIRFPLLGHKLFTYPLSCVRLHPPLLLPPSQQGSLFAFYTSVSERLATVCGLPTRLTPHPMLVSPRPHPHHLASPPPTLAPPFGLQVSVQDHGDPHVLKLLGDEDDGGGSTLSSTAAPVLLPSCSMSSSFTSSSPTSTSTSTFLPLSLAFPHLHSPAFSLLSSSPLLPPPLPPSCPKLVPIFSSKHSSSRRATVSLPQQKQRLIGPKASRRLTLCSIKCNAPPPSSALLPVAPPRRPSFLPSCAPPPFSSLSPLLKMKPAVVRPSFNSSTRQDTVLKPLEQMQHLTSPISRATRNLTVDPHPDMSDCLQSSQGQRRRGPGPRDTKMA